MQDFSTTKSRQSLARAITPAEQGLSDALFEIFGDGVHDFEQVAAQLEERRIARPSGDQGRWSVAALEDELKRINLSLDEAYQGGHARLAD